MSLVAVFGSRKWPDLEQVERFITALWRAEPEDIIVSGGADGVDKRAETLWLGFGGQVVSFRPVKLADVGFYPCWGIQKWHLGGPHPSVNLMHGDPTWATFEGAAFYRNMLIAEYANKGVAYHTGGSGGTAGTIDAFKAEKKPCYVYKVGEDVPRLG